MAMATWPTRRRLRIGKARKRQRPVANPEDGEIRHRVAADHVRAHRSAIRQRDADASAAIHDMTVGEGEAVGGKDHARPAAAADIDLDDARSDRLDGADHRIRIGAPSRSASSCGEPSGIRLMAHPRRRARVRHHPNWEVRDPRQRLEPACLR